jgi:hypothetical protein
VKLLDALLSQQHRRGMQSLLRCLDAPSDHASECYCSCRSKPQDRVAVKCSGHQYHVPLLEQHLCDGSCDGGACSSVSMCCGHPEAPRSCASCCDTCNLLVLTAACCCLSSLCRCVLAHCCAITATRGRWPSQASAGADAAACTAAGQLRGRAAGAVVLTDAGRACTAQAAHQGKTLHHHQQLQKHGVVTVLDFLLHMC